MAISNPALVYLLLSILFFLAMLRPQWAILACLAILPSYLLKLSIFGIPTTVLELSIYAAFIGSFCSLLVFKSNTTLTPSLIRRGTGRFFWPIIAFTSITLLSAFFSNHLKITLGGWKAWVFDPLLIFILIIKFFRPPDIWKIISSLTVSSAIISAYGLFEYFFYPQQLGDGRLDSVFDPANYHAMLVGPIIVLAIGFIFNQQTSRTWKFALGVFSAINIFALVFTFSYGGYLAVLGGLVLYGFLILNRAQKKKIIFGALIIFAIFIILASPTKKFQDLFEFQERSSGHARLEIWQTSWLIFKEHPILGVGMNDFEYHYRENLPRVAFPPLEWLVAQPHSLYLALLTQTGLLSFLTFLWLIIKFIKSTLQPSNQILTTYYLLLASMSVILIHGLVDTPYFKNDLSVFFWVLIALLIIQNYNAPKKQTT